MRGPAPQSREVHTRREPQRGIRNDASISTDLLDQDRTEQRGVALLLGAQGVVDPRRARAPHPVHEDAHALPVRAVELPDPQAIRGREVIDEVSALAQHHDLDVADLEAAAAQPVDQVGGLVGGIGLPLEGLVATGEEGDLGVDGALDLVIAPAESEG